MTEPTLEFLGQQLLLVQVGQREMRNTMRDFGYDLKVLTGIVLTLAREMEHVKDVLGRIDGRLSAIEAKLP
jgi:hypothetical protein